jgi:hypothetical protein
MKTYGTVEVSGEFHVPAALTMVHHLGFFSAVHLSKLLEFSNAFRYNIACDPNFACHAACFTLASSLAYSSTLKMEAKCSSETPDDSMGYTAVYPR